MNVAKLCCKIQRLGICTQKAEPENRWINECRSSVWFSTLHVCVSVITTSMKTLSSKQRRFSPRRSDSHPSDYPNGTYRHALFTGVLILNGQRNQHKQLLPLSTRERGNICAIVCAETPLTHWFAKKLSKMQRNIFFFTFLGLPLIHVLFHCVDSV